jgi:hypothetical protein
MDSRTSTFLTTSVLVLALALALAGPAQSMVVGDGDGGQVAVVIPNDQGGTLGVGGIETQTAPAPDWFERAAQRGQQADYGSTTVRPDDQGGTLGVGGIETQTASAPDWFERAAQRGQQADYGSTTVRPDDKGGARGVGTLSKLVVISPTTADNGFDWQTIGFGAGAFVFALCAAALGAMTLAGRRQTPAH